MQQSDTCYGGQIPHSLCPLQIAQRPADDQKYTHARNDCKQFFDQTFRCGTRHNGKSHRAQEKRQCLRLKAGSAEHAQTEIQRPLQPNQSAEGGQLQRGIAAAEKSAAALSAAGTASEAAASAPDARAWPARVRVPA